MTTGAIAAICGLFGLVIGSFLNVVIWRVPRRESVVSPPSHCPACEHRLSPLENVPVVSWLVLRGRCRHCGTRIPARYPLVEVATAAVWAAVGARFAHELWALPAYLLMGAALVAISVIDLDHLIIPNRIVYPVGIAAVPLLAVASAGAGDWVAWGRALGGGVAYFAVFYALWLVVGGRALGFGDVRLAAVLGLFLGWLGLAELAWGMFLPFLVGSVVGILAVVPLLAVPMAVAGALGWALGVDVVETWTGASPDDPGRARVVVGAGLALLVGSGLYLGLSVARRIPRGRQIPFGPSMAIGALLVVLLSGSFLA